MRLRHLYRISGIAFIVVVARFAAAQSASSVGSAETFRGDYAVPESPAATMLTLDESKLLRPATARALATSLSSATGDLSFIPRTISVEFSPGLLKDGAHLTAQEYSGDKYWYRTRFSIAAKRDSGAKARSQVAAAVRLGLQDNSDLRTNKAFQKAILALTDFKRDSMLLVDTRAAALGLKVTARDSLSQNDQATLATIERGVAAELSTRAKAVRDSVKRAREQSLWAVDVLDVAAGIRASSADSTGGHTRFDGVAGWLTKGWALSQSAQILLGGRGAYERDLTDTAHSELRRTGDAAVRLYLGSNRYKVSAEIQGTARASSLPGWLGKIGGELQLADVVWVDMSAGWKATGTLSKGRFVSSLKLKLNPAGS